MNKHDQDKHTIFKHLQSVARGIVETFGPRCEVVVHDLRRPDSSLIIVEGNVTGRKEGAPLTDLVLRLLRSGKTQEDLINYPTQTRDGRPLKSSTIFLRDIKGKPFGCLCINYDLTDVFTAKQLLDELHRTCQPLYTDSSLEEDFARSVKEVLSDIIRKVLELVGKPVTHMGKEDKLRVVKLLDDKGVFLIKGAVETVAKVLGVSTITLYKYLREVGAETQTSVHSP
jgi:predicted transcriptional regulator YheO